MMKKRTLGCICGGLLLGAFLYWQNNGLILTKMTYRGEIPAGFDGYKILQIADLQNKVFGRRQEPLLRKIEQSCPDIIVISGDLVDRHESGEWEILEEALVEAGVTVLNNGKSVIERNGDTITLLGLADKKANRHYDLLLHSLMAGQEDSFNILLSHRPELFETYVHEGLDLVFTGHAHGGQIVIPFFRQGIFAPHQGFFPKYTEGMHEKDGTVMIVSRGLGNSSFPFRIFNRPELIEVTLRQEGK